MLSKFKSFWSRKVRIDFEYIFQLISGILRKNISSGWSLRRVESHIQICLSPDTKSPFDSFEMFQIHSQIIEDKIRFLSFQNIFYICIISMDVFYIMFLLYFKGGGIL